MNLPELPEGFGFKFTTSEDSTTVTLFSKIGSNHPNPVEKTTFQHGALIEKTDWLMMVNNAAHFLWDRYQGKRERQQWIQEINNGR